MGLHLSTRHEIPKCWGDAWGIDQMELSMIESKEKQQVK